MVWEGLWRCLYVGVQGGALLSNLRGPMCVKTTCTKLINATAALPVIRSQLQQSSGQKVKQTTQEVDLSLGIHVYKRLDSERVKECNDGNIL